MKRINILDDLTINKIAAGEVVERPSSVVKELVENSIDANATKIIVDIIDGGKKQIKIIDNGDGITSSEVEKSFLRHATSKINNVNDLYNLSSLGFRGEALASISSISKLEMITKTKDEVIGTKIIVHGGKIISKEPIGANNGTTIIIRDIFYNTPVRYKFLKSTQAETISISDLINKISISNPGVSFRYINNNKSMLNTPGDNKFVNVIRSIYGKDITTNLIELNYECEYFSVSGYIGNNNVYRSNKNLQHIYINNRFVKSKVILDAILEAYKAIIPINKHAVCFLDINIDPSKVDVNIHPTKLEVKFEDEKEIYTYLKNTLRDKLLHINLVGKFDFKENNIKKSLIKENDNIKLIDELKVSDCHKQDIKLTPKEELEKLKNTSKIKKIEDVSKIEIIDVDKNISNEFCDLTTDLINEKLKEEKNKDSLYELDKKDISTEELTYNDSSNKEDIYTKQTESDSVQEELPIYESLESNNKEKVSFEHYNIIGVFLNTYIILQRDESLYLLDQHAAHERILYERYMNKFKSKNIDMQLLLDPIVIELSNVDMIKIEENIQTFLNFGFEIEIFGNNHIMIRCVPTIFGIPESEKFIIEILDNIDDLKSSYDLKEEKFASMACRSAIKANDKIYNIEIKELLSQMNYCENAFTCPHGRPILVEISKKDIEKMFKRII